jgi:hypothetical protein
MKRAELEHLIRAAGSIANARELIIIGSQAILASFPNPPPELAVSQEADLWAVDAPEKSDLIDGSIGELSPFHDTFGYYGHGIAKDTPVLPVNWKSRLVRIQNENTNNIAGLCLSPADIVISKLAAGREKDMEYARALFRHRLIKPAQVEALFSELDDATLSKIKPRFLRCLAAAA